MRMATSFAADKWDHRVYVYISADKRDYRVYVYISADKRDQEYMSIYRPMSGIRSICLYIGR